MLYLCITLGAFVIVGIISLLISKEPIVGIRNGALAILPAMLCSLISAIICLAILSPDIKPELYDANVIMSEYSLCALQDNIETSQNVGGTFFLGCGHVSGHSSNDLYYYYFKDTKYGKKFGKISAANTYIKETNEISPKIQFYSGVNYKPKSKFVKNWLLFDGVSESDSYTIIYIPENSIYANFSIDMQ